MPFYEPNAFIVSLLLGPLLVFLAAALVAPQSGPFQCQAWICICVYARNTELKSQIVTPGATIIYFNCLNLIFSVFLYGLTIQGPKIAKYAYLFNDSPPRLELCMSVTMKKGKERKER